MEWQGDFERCSFFPMSCAGQRLRPWLEERGRNGLRHWVSQIFVKGIRAGCGCIPISKCYNILEPFITIIFIIGVYRYFVTGLYYGYWTRMPSNSWKLRLYILLLVLDLETIAVHQFFQEWSILGSLRKKMFTGSSCLQPSRGVPWTFPGYWAAARVCNLFEVFFITWGTMSIRVGRMSQYTQYGF
jgi:hypothetical protein